MKAHLFAMTDHDLRGFDGTWRRKWSISLIHLGPFALSLSLRVSRMRGKSVPTSPSPSHTSSWKSYPDPFAYNGPSLIADDEWWAMRAQSREQRPGWDQASVGDTSPSPKDQDTASPSARSGAGR